MDKFQFALQQALNATKYHFRKKEIINTYFETKHEVEDAFEVSRKKINLLEHEVYDEAEDILKMLRTMKRNLF
jgi:hypothetical protein